MSNIVLSYRLNTCPLCLICLHEKCSKVYGESCICQLTTIYWGRNVKEYINFHTKSLTYDVVKKKNTKFDPEFATWFWANISPHLEISSSQSLINLCKKCLNKYDYSKGIFYTKFYYYSLIIYL